MADEKVYSADLFEWTQALGRFGTWSVDIKNNGLYWSKETYRIHELKEGTPVSIDEAIKFYHPDDRGIIDQAVEEGISQAKPWDLVLRIITAKSKVRSVRASGRPIFDDSNELVRLEGIFQELDLHEGAEKSLLHMSKTNYDFESILDKLSIIARTDKYGRIIYANDMFCDISGYTREELLGKDHKILNSNFHSDDFFKNLWDTILSGKEWRGEIRNQRKDGSYYWVDTVIKPQVDEVGEIREFLAIRRDITPSKERHDADIKIARLAAIGETTAQIVHDVMNPLAIISGNIGRLDRQFEGSMDLEKSKSILVKMGDAVDRIQDIFKGLRGNLIGEKTVERFSMKAMLDSAIDELDPLIKSSKFKVIFESDIDYKYVGNESQIKQVFVNLFKNAIQANESNSEKWIKLNLLKIGGYKVIQVTDSGKGISSEVQEKMFDSLFTTKQDKGGTGLGLGICKQIVEGHNGKISLNPTHKNTQFEVVFKDS